jgi:hypothetical protein
MVIVLVLLLAFLLGGLGFAIHVLWWIALVVLVIWLLGFVVRMGEAGSRGRWYRWSPTAGGRLRLAAAFAASVGARAGTRTTARRTCQRQTL